MGKGQPTGLSHQGAGCQVPQDTPQSPSAWAQLSHPLPTPTPIHTPHQAWRRFLKDRESTGSWRGELSRQRLGPALSREAPGRGGRDRQLSFSKARDFRGMQPTLALKFSLQTPPGGSPGRLQSLPWKSERHVTGPICVGEHVLPVALWASPPAGVPSVPSPATGPEPSRSLFPCVPTPVYLHTPSAQESRGYWNSLPGMSRL